MTSNITCAGWSGLLRCVAAAGLWLAIVAPAQGQTNLPPPIQVAPPNVQPPPIRPPVIVPPRVNVNPVQPNRLPGKRREQQATPGSGSQQSSSSSSRRTPAASRVRKASPPASGGRPVTRARPQVAPPLPRAKPESAPPPPLPVARPDRTGRDATARLGPAGPYEPDILLAAFPAGTASSEVEQLVGPRGLMIESRTHIALLGLDLYRLRIVEGATVPGRLTEPPIPGATAIQPNYLYELQDATPAKSVQYAAARLRIVEAHRIATGRGVRIAVIDTGIDRGHTDVAKAVVEHFDAVGGEVELDFLRHGTAMAGAIAASGKLVGIAPGAQLLSARAFAPRSAARDPAGTTYAILQCLDWADQRRANILNMSFAGPADPLLLRAVDRLGSKGTLMIAAAGNRGPEAPPAYPAAHPAVIAVTATDRKDQRYPSANVGDYLAVAAPGVEVLATVPDGFDLFTGTSISAAYVSGVAALLLERNPDLPAKELLAILQETATDLGGPGIDREFGAGLVETVEALQALERATSASPVGSIAEEVAESP